MPELGKYAFAVLTSYGITMPILFLLTLGYLLRAKSAKIRLDAAEALAETAKD